MFRISFDLLSAPIKSVSPSRVNWVFTSGPIPDTIPANRKTSALEQAPLNLVIIILNATQIDRQVSLAIQLQHLGLPALLLLNMSDEAANYGVAVNPDLLAQRLGMSVVLLSAKYGMGYDPALQRIAIALDQQILPLATNP